jgi:hypothetical protein
VRGEKIQFTVEEKSSEVVGQMSFSFRLGIGNEQVIELVCTSKAPDLLNALDLVGKKIRDEILAQTAIVEGALR